MMQAYTEVAIRADEHLKEQLIGILSQLGFEGFWEDGPTLRSYMSADRWKASILAEVERVVKMLHHPSMSPMPTVSFTTIENRNWNDEWEKTIHPIHVTDRIVIAPTWQKYTPQPNEILITIDPKMSFGTGYHETTRLVLQLMQQYVRPGMTLLDLGTGTGILAISGIKLGAASAVGVDNDAWAFENALENVKLNHVEQKVQILLGDVSSVAARRFDLIAANIQRSVIEPMLPQMYALLASNGIMILSGLLLEDQLPITRAILSCGGTVAKTAQENEWIALLCTRT